MGDGRGDSQRAWHEFAGLHFDGVSILDVGAGIGLSRERLARGGRNRVTTLDIERTRMGAVDIICDPRDLEGRWDVVTSFDVIEHVPDARAFIAQLVRLARRAVFVTTPAFRLYPHPWHFRPGEIESIAESVPGPKRIAWFARYKSGDADTIEAISRERSFSDETIYAHGIKIDVSSSPSEE